MPPSRARRYMGQDVTSRPDRYTRARIRFQHAANHAETGRLARAVRAEQADDFALPDVQMHTVHHAAAPE